MSSLIRASHPVGTSSQSGASQIPAKKPRIIPRGSAKSLPSARAVPVSAIRSAPSGGTTPRCLERTRAARSSGERSSSGGGIDGGMELTLVERPACATEVKLSPDNVMGFLPSEPPLALYRFLLPLQARIVYWRSS